MIGIRKARPGFPKIPIQSDAAVAIHASAFAITVARHIREPLVAAVVAEGQPFVVEAEQVQNRRVDVVDVRLVLARRAGRRRRWRR